MEMKRYQKEENFSPEKIAKLREHYKAILELLGEDPAREGLLKTPERVAKAMSFLTQGYEDDPLSIIRSATFKEEYRQMVLVKDIELYSLCEHHMLVWDCPSPPGAWDGCWRQWRRCCGWAPARCPRPILPPPRAATGIISSGC